MLYNVIMSFSSRKSCGPDNINPKLIVENCQLLIKPLLHLFNRSLIQGVVPDSMKIAKVIPLFKKGDSTSPGNYRPISLLSFFSKLLEKIIFNRMYCFLSKNNSLYKYQFGFRKKHSTSLALLDVIDNCYTNMALGHKALGIFFDLQKAFDSVNHNILLKKLYHYEIRGQMHAWFVSYSICQIEDSIPVSI